MKNYISILILLCSCLLGNAAKQPKYVFYFIGDGMGMGHVMSTECYNRVVLGNDDPILMMTFPVASTVRTFSHNWPITDSAAAGTALSTGTKTDNGMIGMSPDTLPVYSIANRFKELGYGVGIATSVAPDDATPAAFYAHVPNRSMYYEIGSQAAKSKVDFLAGSNLRGLVDKKGNKTDLWQQINNAGFKVVRGYEQLKKTDADRILLLNTDTVRSVCIGYTIDSIPGVLNLPEITQGCLDHMLKVSPDKFFMMVEGGNIDHAAHANDAGGVIKEILNFQQAIQIAYDFYLKHKDETLIVITADHDTGGMTVGNGIVGYNVNPKYVDYQKISKDNFADYWKKEVTEGHTPTWEEMKEFLTNRLGFWQGVPITDKETDKLKEAFDESFTNKDGKDLKTLYNTYNRFVVDVFKTLDRHTGFAWTTNGHTGNFVPVFAIGVGADLFKGDVNNIEIPQKIISLIKK